MSAKKKILEYLKTDKVSGFEKSEKAYITETNGTSEVVKHESTDWYVFRCGSRLKPIVIGCDFLKKEFFVSYENDNRSLERKKISKRQYDAYLKALQEMRHEA